MQLSVHPKQFKQIFEQLRIDKNKKIHFYILLQMDNFKIKINHK